MHLLQKKGGGVGGLRIGVRRWDMVLSIQYDNFSMISVI